MPALAKKDSPVDISLLVKELLTHTTRHSESQYEIGRICSAIRANGLYKANYNSFTDFVNNELQFSPATAAKYATLFDDFQYLGVDKKKALTLLAEFPLVSLCRLLREVEELPTKAAIRKIIYKDEYKSNAEQINLTFATKRMGKRLDNLLIRHGMVIEKKKTRQGEREFRYGARAAIALLVEEHERLLKAQKKKR